MKKVLTVLLILAMVFSLAGFAVAEDSVDTMPQSACLGCGFIEGHDVSCPLYAAELPLPEFSDACSECGGVFGEHAESCSAYVISDDESSFADVPQTGDEPVDGDDTLLPESPETPDTPQSFSGQLLAADTRESEPVAVYLTEPRSGYIYFDLAAGDVTINADNTYTGYVFSSSGSTEKINGKHTASNKYYIYQTNGSKSPSIPSYDRVGHPTKSGKYWGDYITNNSAVSEVVSNWTLEAKKVGRKSTNYRISITGSSTYNITIDNLWSSYSRNGIFFEPPQEGGHLVVNFKGDNRFCSIHYFANELMKSSLTFQEVANSNATLTVASFDGKANYWQSVIGSTDAKDHAVGIVINSGTIYSGADHGDVCTAIGGGGNGYGHVTINGGKITAVSSSSGATIGGGIAERSTGGRGYVEIAGGEVYAYNLGYVTHIYSNSDEIKDSNDDFVDKVFIPASAIGGGSSSREAGSSGTVNITGGKVFALSVGGTAIGGGSSATKSGGGADVKISGTAQVTAKSVSGTVWNRHGTYSTTVDAGTAIGGGTGKTVGGSAMLQVSGYSVLHTGSIGGGSGETRVGSAQVTISGGTLLGQVIMQGMDAHGQPSSFTMTGGIIDNANHAGYNFQRKDGGAVWINSGEASMSGGIIKNANATNGGAIYVNGGSFAMSGGGEIQNCTATENGGAVYVSDGKVTMSGGTINGVSAKEGGAVYVNAESTAEDSFTMSGGTIQNAKATSGNGGAVAVANGMASMSEGSILRSTATGNGGGVSVSGGSFTLSGGTIGGDDLSTRSSAVNGGAVSVSGGTFTMTDGTIQFTGATTGDGGAVYVAGGSATMSGGTIQNTASTSGSGGAVAVSNGDFVISGGTIQTVGAQVNGGAVSVSGSGSVEMSGSAVIKNTTTQGNGGAISVSGGSFTMSGGTIGGTDLEKSTAVNGGAVAVNDGAFTMSAGLIQNSTATGNGGAVYVTGGTASVSGGSMRSCSAVDGGAVYVSVTGNPTEDSFTMSSSAEIASCTATGNGGAVCVAGGNAHMENGDIEKCSAVNGGAVYISNGNFTIDFGDVSSCTATGNGGAVAVLNGNFVMDSGNLTANIAEGDGGGAYVNGGLITIGNVSCKDGKVPTHVHPTTKDNNAKNGGAFSVSGGTLTVYCGEYSGNTATDSNSNSIYQTDGKVNIFEGVDEASLPLSEVLITGNTFVYTDARSNILTVTLYRISNDDTPVSILVDSNKYHSIRLNKSLLTDNPPPYTGTQLMGWSLNKTDTNVTVKNNPKEYYPENSKYPVTGGGNVTFYGIWGDETDVLAYTIIIPDSIEITGGNTKGTGTISVSKTEPFFIPYGVGSVLVTLGNFDGKFKHLENLEITLSYNLTSDTTLLSNNNVAATFRYSQEETYPDVTLTAKVTDEPIYAGTYTDTVTFSVSTVIAEYDSDNTNKECYTGATP